MTTLSRFVNVKPVVVLREAERYLSLCSRGGGKMGKQKETRAGKTGNGGTTDQLGMGKGNG